MRKDDFIGQGFYWFTGVIEDAKDPKKMNRVKVRCHGYHGKKDVLATEDLPWATVMMPSTSQSSKGYGRTHELEVDSWVVGFFRDGVSSQDPIIMGSIATQTDNTIDIPEEAQLEDPTNKVYKSQSGHLVEFDNTDDKERIHIKHTNGTSAEITDDNNLTVSVAKGGNLTITVLEGNTKIITAGDTNIESTGDSWIKATGTARMRGGQKVIIEAADKVRIQ